MRVLGAAWSYPTCVQSSPQITHAHCSGIVCYISQPPGMLVVLAKGYILAAIEYLKLYRKREASSLPFLLVRQLEPCAVV